MSLVNASGGFRLNFSLAANPGISRPFGLHTEILAPVNASPGEFDRIPNGEDRHKEQDENRNYPAEIGGPFRIFVSIIALTVYQFVFPLINETENGNDPTQNGHIMNKEYFT